MLLKLLFSSIFMQYCGLTMRYTLFWGNMMLSGWNPVCGIKPVKAPTLHPLAGVGWSWGWTGELRVHYNLLIKTIDLFLWLLAKPTRISIKHSFPQSQIYYTRSGCATLICLFCEWCYACRRMTHRPWMNQNWIAFWCAWHFWHRFTWCAILSFQIY